MQSDSFWVSPMGITCTTTSRITNTMLQSSIRYWIKSLVYCFNISVYFVKITADKAKLPKWRRLYKTSGNVLKVWFLVVICGDDIFYDFHVGFTVFIIYCFLYIKIAKLVILNPVNQSYQAKNLKNGRPSYWLPVRSPYYGPYYGPSVSTSETSIQMNLKLR